MVLGCPKNFFGWYFSYHICMLHCWKWWYISKWETDEID